MEIIRDSSVDEYARHFWNRQRTKPGDNDKDALTDIDNGGDPCWWLWKKYHYKLPRPDYDTVAIALLDQEDVEALLIENHTVDDRWMQEHCLVPQPRTRVLSALAIIAINRNYFGERRHDPLNRQHKYYREWLSKGPLEGLKGAITAEKKTLIQYVEPNKYEIVDGWGRLLPFAALLQQGYRFHPVESFVAWRGCIAPNSEIRTLPPRST